MLIVLLVPLALALIVVSVLGIAGIGPLTDDRRAGRAGVLGSVGPAVGLLAGLVLVAVSVFGTLLLVGLAGEEDDDRTKPAAPGAVATTTPPVSQPAPAAPRPVEQRRTAPTGAGLGPEVDLEPADTGTFPTAYSVVGGLEPGTVLQVRARGFEPFAAAVAEQCARTTAGRQCFNQIPVQFDSDGVARFQYLVTTATTDPVRGRCRADAAPCVVVVRSVHDDTRAQVQTIFGEQTVRPGRILVSPTALAHDGEVVTVEVRGYPPGVAVTAMLCAPPDAIGARCGAPGPSAPLVVGPDGRGRARLKVRAGSVGIAGASCGRGDRCGISVASPDVFTRAPVVPITFAGPPGAAYDPSRLLLGLGIAALLAAMGAWLILRTDWSAVGEAAAPEIDEAEYADLDAIIAALPPEPDELVPTA